MFRNHARQNIHDDNVSGYVGYQYAKTRFRHIARTNGWNARMHAPKIFHVSAQNHVQKIFSLHFGPLCLFRCYWHSRYQMPSTLLTGFIRFMEFTLFTYRVQRLYGPDPSLRVLWGFFQGSAGSMCLAGRRGCMGSTGAAGCTCPGRSHGLYGLSGFHRLDAAVKLLARRGFTCPRMCAGEGKGLILPLHQTRSTIRDS